MLLYLPHTNMTTMKKAVIYSRVSTQEQSFQSQIEDLQKYAEYANLQIVDVFAEKASGFDIKVERPEYDRMKEFVVENSIDLIICWELSRFGRGSLHTLKEIDFYTQKKIDIYFKKENINTLSDNPLSKFMLNILSGIAEMERETIVSRSARGKVSAAQKGKRIGFPIMPYGFQSNDGYIAINEEEAKNVRMMYEMAAQGNSLRAIINKLNSLNILTRNNKRGHKKTLSSGEIVEILWRTNTLRKILTSTLYKGERNYKGGIVVKIPQIVNEETWDKTQSIFKQHIGCVNNTKYDYLFKGKMYCGKCGYIIATRTENRYATLPSYYFCTARREPYVMCKSGQFDSKVFDELIYSQLFRNNSLLEKVYNDTAKEFNLEEKQNQITYFRGEILKQEGIKKRINSIYRDGYSSETELRQEHTAIRNYTLEMENNITKIEKEIQNFTGFDIESIIKKFAAETNFAIKHEFVTKYVDKVLMYSVDSYDIDYTKLLYGELHYDDQSIFESDFRLLRNPHGNDKLIYVELFAFGNPNPLKMSLTNVTKQCYINSNLHYEKGHLALNL